MAKEFILALDAGTQSARALIFDLQGQPVHKTRIPITPYVSPQPSWAEQDPDVYWDALAAACQQLWRERPDLRETIAGVALTTFASAGTSLVLSLAPNPYAAYEIIFWLMGSLADRSLTHVALALPLIAAGLAVLLHASRKLEALALGEDSARSLGVDVGRLKLTVVIGTALAVGPGVAVAGFIGFVGLLVPHALRPFVGSRPSRLLPLSALGGALATLLADIACRLVPTLGELKLGIVTALFGAPFFLWLLTRERRLGA